MTPALCQQPLKVNDALNCLAKTMLPSLLTHTGTNFVPGHGVQLIHCLRQSKVWRTFEVF